MGLLISPKGSYLEKKNAFNEDNVTEVMENKKGDQLKNQKG